MRLGVLIFFVTVLAASVALPQTSAHPAAKRKKAVATKKTGRKPVVAAYRQMAPTPDRYREIQQALVDKGYLKTEPNGVWDSQSSDALKQFQTDQKLSPTGKISSASLINLGLGPKPATAPAAPAALPATPADPPATP